MTLAEFKAWFDGFTESMDSTPNEKQWARIRARVGEINGVAITQTVYVDRYIDRTPYRQYWGYSSNTAFGASSAGVALLSTGGKASDELYREANAPGGTGGDKFDSHLAMLDLGKAEYLSS